MKKTLYIFRNGNLKRKNQTLLLETENGSKYIPVEDTNEILIFGEVDFNKRLLEFLSQKEILLHLFNHYGYYVGSFYPREHLNSGYMILKQAICYQDDEKRLQLAKALIHGAVYNILQVLKYYRNRGKNVAPYMESIASLQGLVEASATIEELMALEGNMRGYYYQSFDPILENKEFVFENRSKQPPKNKLNALVSFGNTLLYTTVLSEIYKTHLDPRIGFLHATNFRRFTLNLDVAEVFKPVFVDRLIFSLVAKKMIAAKDFDQRAGGTFLTERGKKIFITEWDKRLKTTIKHRNLGRNVSNRRFIRLELYKIQKHLMGEKTYIPYKAQW
ncbi:type I-B CRISPR-associated endonuclease Cas1b [Melghirimyces algeriensis]|uniref:CRISPR-associated endonuclease Cas1 n=1 Tax=Melghirimyces algeriensis TaxID=910412 RepID=A0A521ETA9_9BACL|nr:type I-B CRISPR-associated endonuclease Cas1b [Melghirimyces algeriensis]SMO87186.1 CRISP-associated protein Cas1 [Melghirimyces algeriensis]